MDTPSDVAHLVLSAAIAAPLIYAGTSKVLDPSRFARTINKFGIGRLHATVESARAIAFAELFTGVTLSLVADAASALVTATVYGGLAVAMVRAIRRGSTGDCGCFGALGGQIDGIAVARNVALAAASAGLASARAANLVAAYEVRLALMTVVAIALGAAAVETFMEIRRTAR